MLRNTRLLYCYLLLAAVLVIGDIVDEFHFRILTLTVLIISFVVLLYARFVEPFWLKTHIFSFPFKGGSTPIRVALLADIQVSRYKDTAWVERIVATTIAAKPDIVLIAGDMINNQFPKEDEIPYLNPLKKLAVQIPTYYVLGNHDYGMGAIMLLHFKEERISERFDDRSEDVVRAMRDLDVTLLRNELITVTIKGQKLCLFGSDDLWSKRADLSNLSNWDKQTPLIFLAHNPDTVKLWPAAFPPPLITFTGHTHGGQLMFWKIPLSSAAVELGSHYYRGLKYYRDIPMYISTGLSESTAPLRLGARPEVAIIDLVPQKD